MQDLGKAYVQIIPSTGGMKGAIESAVGGSANPAGQRFGSAFAKKLKTIVTTAGIGVALGKSLSEGAKLEQSLGGIETLFKDHADQVIANADRAWQTAGFSANEYMELATSFSASLLSSLGGDTKKAGDMTDKAIIQISDNANKMGSSLESVTMAYQGFAKGQYQLLDNLKLGYGGTKTEMLRLLADAEKITGVKYDIDNLADVYTAIGVIQDELGITGTTAKEAEATLSGSFASMKASATNFLGNLAMGREIESSMVNLAQSTATFLFKNLIPALGRIVIALPKAFGALIKTGAPQFAQQGVEMVKSLANGMNGNVTNLITGFAGNILSKIPVMVNAIRNLFTNAVAWVSANAGTIGARAGAFVGALAKTIIANLPSIIKASARLVIAISKALLKLPGMALRFGISAIKGLIKGLTPTGLKQKASSIVRTIISPISGLVAKVRSIIDKVKNALKNIFSGISFKFPKMPKLHIVWSSESKDGSGGLKIKIPKPSLKWYASGGIATSASVVGIGEGRENEAILPLDTFWSRLHDELSAGSGSGGVVNLILNLDGETIAKSTIDYVNGQTIRYGVNPLTI